MESHMGSRGSAAPVLFLIRIGAVGPTDKS